MGENNDKRTILYFSQSEISDLCRIKENGLTGVDELIEKIIRIDPNYKMKLEKYDTFKINNKSDLNEKITKFLLCRIRIKELSEQIMNIGNRKGIEKEIEKYKKEISELKKGIDLAFTEEEKSKYSEQKKNLKENESIIKLNESDITQLELLKDYQIFNSIDGSLTKVSIDLKTIIRDYFNDIKTQTHSKWYAFINKRIDVLSKLIVDLKKRNQEIEEDPVYIKGKDGESGNISFVEKEKLLEQEIDKLQRITELEIEKKSKEEEKESVKQEIKKMYLRYYTEVLQITKEIVFEKEDVKIKSLINFNKNEFFDCSEKSFNLKTGDGNSVLDKKDCSIEEFLSLLDEVFMKLDTEKIVAKKNNLQQTYISLFTENYFNISFDVLYDGDQLSQMSEGKKAFIVLRLLLDFDDSNCPILIDQPEDDLDNRAIYEDLVKYLRNKKQKRQIILVTHNPNIVVGADAELVIVANQNGEKNKNTNDVQFQYYGNSIENTFRDDKEEAILLSRGIREHICEILEGGEKAFEIREKKYGYKK